MLIFADNFFCAKSDKNLENILRYGIYYTFNPTARPLGKNPIYRIVEKSDLISYIRENV
jgi:hypothetical protein